MTCIVGVVGRDGSVLIGGDSCAGDNHSYSIDTLKDPKVFRSGEFVIGYTTSFRMGDLLRYKFEPPKLYAETEISAYMRTSFIDEVRKTLKDGGFAQKEKDRESGGCFLVGIKGRLFRIDDDYQVGEPADGMGAVGCGAQAARGALFALGDTAAENPQVAVLTALRAAEACYAYVRAPFHLEKA